MEVFILMGSSSEYTWGHHVEIDTSNKLRVGIRTRWGTELSLTFRLRVIHKIIIVTV